MVKPLKHSMFSNVKVGPTKALRPIYGGGLLEPKKYPRYCNHNRHGKIIPTSEKTDLSDLPTLEQNDDEIYIYGGVYLFHFGHFIAEFIHRLWVTALPEYQNCTVVFVAKENALPPRPFFTDIMAYMGIQKWIILDTAHTVKKLVIAEQAKTLGRKCHAEHLPYLSALAAKVSNTEPQQTHKKIAILRGHMNSRRYVAEHHLEAYLAEQGYHIFRPEEHSLSVQLQTILHADKIIIADGSSCHLFDLLPSVKAKTAFLARRRKSKMGKTSLAPKARHTVTYKNVQNLIVPFNKIGKPQDTRALLFAPLEDVVLFLKKEGFIEKNAPSISTPPYKEDTLTYLSHWHSRLKGQNFSENDIEKMLLKLQRRSKLPIFLRKV